MKEDYKFWALLVLYLCVLWGSKGIFAQQEMFDDFNYSSNTDSELGNINQWQIIDGHSGPPAGAVYSRELIKFYNDSSESNNRIMGIETYADGISENTRHSRIETANMPYLHGTFAARVYFDDTPQQYGDGNVETFYTIGSYTTCSDANQYSEVDFEYLPWDAWDPNSMQQTMYYTSWETCNASTSKRSDISFQGWHTCVFTSMPGSSVNYYIDNDLVATISEKTPNAYQNISFANWIVDNIVGASETQRNTRMQVDWVYHIKDQTISTNEVNQKVKQLRQNKIIRKNLNGQQVVIDEVQTSFISIFNKTGLQIHPNPFTTNLTVNYLGEKANINIIDAGGRIIISKLGVVPSQIIDVSSLSKGFYFIQIEVDGIKEVQNLIKL